MTIDQLATHDLSSIDQTDQIDPLDELSRDQLAIDVLAADVRAADAAVPDPPPGSGTAAVLSRAPSPDAGAPRPGAGAVPRHASAPLRDAGSPSSCAGALPVPWAQSRRWAQARVVPLAPAVVATAWLTALARGDGTTTWSTTDPNLRLALAQQWLDGLGRTGDNVTAWSLAAEVPHIGLWAPFAEQLFARWSTDLGRTAGDRGIPEVIERHQFRPTARPDVGRELCVVEAAGRGTDSAPQPLTLRLRDRWHIAGLGRGVLQPGWPARWIAIEADPHSSGALG